jgi:WhiB family redox-sensing transcriptional regulator
LALSWVRSTDWDASDWRKEAACRFSPPDLFFPVGRTGPAISQIEAAKAVCRTCPSQSACLEFALATNQESGVWGGTSEDERRSLRPTWLARRHQDAGRRQEAGLPCRQEAPRPRQGQARLQPADRR